MFERTIVGSLRPYMKDILGRRAGCYKLDETLAKVANWHLATIKTQQQMKIQIQILFGEIPKQLIGMSNNI